MHKSDMKFPIKNLNYRDLPFPSGFFLKFGRKKLWPQTSPFFDILVYFFENL